MIEIEIPKCGRLERGINLASERHNKENKDRDPKSKDKSPSEYCEWVLLQAAESWAAEAEREEREKALNPPPKQEAAATPAAKPEAAAPAAKKGK